MRKFLKARRKKTSRRGNAIVASLALTLVAAGLCGALVQTSIGRAGLVRASRSGGMAMEVAKTGLALARAEVFARKDLDGGGVGASQGALAGGTYEVTAEDLDAEHVRLVATGRFDRQVRTCESVIELLPPPVGSFLAYGAFGKDWVNISSNAWTDAYESSDGTYASQTPTAEGSVASNGNITILSGCTIQGDAIPGDGNVTVVASGSTVSGSTVPFEEDLTMPDVDTTPVLNPDGSVKPAARDYSQMTVAGDVVFTGMDCEIKSGTLTIPAGNWYMRSLKVSGSGKLKVSGNVNLFIGRRMEANGGSLVNDDGAPSQLWINGLGNNLLDVTQEFLIAGKMGAVIYAPKMGIRMESGAVYFGSAIGKTVAIASSSGYHYDKSLMDYAISLPGGGGRQISWRKIATPE